VKLLDFLLVVKRKVEIHDYVKKGTGFCCDSFSYRGVCR
jgi:hypothetical protein